MAAKDNPFYIRPAKPDMTPVFQGLGQLAKQTREEKQRAAAQKTITDAIKSNDPMAMADAVVQYPEYSSSAKAAFGFTNQASERAARGTYRRVLSDPENASQYMQQGIEMVNRAGGKPTMMTNDLQMLQQNPNQAMQAIKMGYASIDPEGYKSMFGDGKGAGSIGTYNPRDYTVESFSEFARTGDPSVLERYTEKTVDIGGVPHRLIPGTTNQYEPIKSVEKVAESTAKIENKKELAKLTAQLKLKPEIESAVKDSVARATAIADQAKEGRSNDVAWNTYQAAMATLSSSMGGTSTGPFIGIIPAITANQQIADGAVAAMAPILKQIFRSAGEGTFTDKDQELLLDMVPTRKDRPEARTAKVANIDAILRAKLDQSSSGQSGNAGQANVDDLVNKYAD